MTWINKYFTSAEYAHPFGRQCISIQTSVSSSPSYLRHYLSTTKNNAPPPASPPRPPTSLWKTLKAPALFGVGVYIGLMMFGEHQETKEGSAYLEGLRSKFWGSNSDGGRSGDGSNSN